MYEKILYLREKFPQAEETLTTAFYLYGSCMDYFEGFGLYLEHLEEKLAECRNAFEEQFDSTFEEANETETFENLLLPAKEINELYEEQDIFSRFINGALHIFDSMGAIQDRLLNISKMNR